MYLSIHVIHSPEVVHKSICIVFLFDKNDWCIPRRIRRSYDVVSKNLGYLLLNIFSQESFVVCDKLEVHRL